MNLLLYPLFQMRNYPQTSPLHNQIISTVGSLQRLCTTSDINHFSFSHFYPMRISGRINRDDKREGFSIIGKVSDIQAQLWSTHSVQSTGCHDATDIYIKYVS